MRIVSLFLFAAFFTCPINAEPIAELTNWEYLIENRNENVNCTQGDGWSPFIFPGQPKGIRSGTVLWERTKIPMIPKEKKLRFLTVDQFFQVYLNDIEIFHVGNPSKPDDLTYGNTLHIIDLPKSESPIYLCFRIFSRTSNVGLVSSVFIGSGENHLTEVFQKEIFKLICIGFFLLISIALFATSFLKYGGYGYLSFGLFLTASTVWLLTQTEIKSFLFDNPFFWRVLDIFFLFQIPVWILKFYIEIFGHGPLKINYRLFQFFVIYAILAWFLIVFKFLQLEYLLLPFQISALLAQIWLFYVAFITAKSGDYEGKLFFGGMSVVFITGTLDFLSAMGILFHSKPTVIWGITLLLIFVIVILIRRTASIRFFAENFQNSPNNSKEFFVILQSKYRLTQTEARLCASIVSGVNRIELSKKFQVGDGTIKIHLGSIYKKTIDFTHPELFESRDKFQRLVQFLKIIQKNEK